MYTRSCPKLACHMRMGQNGTMKGRRGIREEVIAEYLSCNFGYRELELRYGIGKSTLQRWVKAAGQERADKATDGRQKALLRALRQWDMGQRTSNLNPKLMGLR